MGRRTQLKIGDALLDVSEEDFEIVKEDWNEYRMLDGGTIRVKTSVHRIFRVLDANGNAMSTPDGDPQVIVRHASQIVAIDR